MSKKKAKKSGSEVRFERFMENIQTIPLNQVVFDGGRMTDTDADEMFSILQKKQVDNIASAAGKTVAITITKADRVTDHPLNESGQEWE